MSAGASAWAAYLDSLEAELSATRAASTAGSPGAGAVFVPPDDLGPLPAELAERARTLVRALETTVDAIDRDLRRTRQQLDELHQMDPRGPRPASALDLRA